MFVLCLRSVHCCSSFKMLYFASFTLLLLSGYFHPRALLLLLAGGFILRRILHKLSIPVFMLIL